jgi:hypothetical protein
MSPSPKTRETEASHLRPDREHPIEDANLATMKQRHRPYEKSKSYSGIQPGLSLAPI